MAPNTRATSTAATINDAEAVCDCRGAGEGVIARSRDRNEYFICSRCARLQHNECYVEDTAERTGPERWLCNLCQAAEITEIETNIASREQEIKDTAERVARKQEEVKGVIMKMLWRHYCHLSDGNATRAVKESTKMKFEGGILVPERLAPQSWIEAVESNLEDFMEACDKKLTDFAIRPEHHVEEMNERVLTPMREIANDLIYCGPYWGNRGKLRVLAEILGLEKKGTVWKG
jgi:hypothetical protein